jgi:lauroyl/myristoyl acyltransferase
MLDIGAGGLYAKIIVNNRGNFIYSAVTDLIGVCPSSIKRYIRDISTGLLYLWWGGKRENVKMNLLKIGKNADRKTVYNIFRNHTANIIDMFELGKNKVAVDSENIEFQGRDNMERALQTGSGVILITAHVGNWERAAFYLSSLGYKLFVVAGVQMNRLFSNSVRKAKEKTGIHVVNPDSSYRALFRGLKSGGIVALLLDGDIYTEGTPVKFFGSTVTMPSGVVRLHRRSGAPILSGYCRRRDNDNYRIVIRDVLTQKTSDELSDGEIMDLLYRELESIISDNFDQWCIFRNLWSNDR